MTLLQGIFLFIAAMLGGILNSVAGGGSFISFPALIFTGVPPINANATNTVALWPGAVASTGAYRKELLSQNRVIMVVLSITSLIGGVLGAILLLNTSQATFVRLIPYLLLLATLLFTFSGPIMTRLRARKRKVDVDATNNPSTSNDESASLREKRRGLSGACGARFNSLVPTADVSARSPQSPAGMDPSNTPVTARDSSKDDLLKDQTSATGHTVPQTASSKGLPFPSTPPSPLRITKSQFTRPSWLTLSGIALLQLVIATYGGYFGGGIGILMLASLGLMGMENIHEMNGLKTFLTSFINGVAVIAFTIAGKVFWPQAILMVIGAIIGGYAGAYYARQLDPRLVRGFVILVGFGMSIYFFLRP
jgi:uncharacterized membrane protein YfcA